MGRFRAGVDFGRGIEGLFDAAENETVGETGFDELSGLQAGRAAEEFFLG
jgi:hypothetical protein